MPKAIRIHKYGGPEAMSYEDVDVGQPGPGEVRLRHTAVGVLYSDTSFRSGLYPASALPFAREPAEAAATEVRSRSV